jgi:esterase/lipase superfamily enzyme
MKRCLIITFLAITALLSGCSNEQQTPNQQKTNTEKDIPPKATITPKKSASDTDIPSGKSEIPTAARPEEEADYASEAASRPSYNDHSYTYSPPGMPKTYPESKDNGREAHPSKTDAETTGSKYALIRTFFATDRNLTGKTNPKKMFGADRAALKYGTCDVSIPRDHRMGELEAPSIFKLEFREDPTKHVSLMAAKVIDKNEYFRQLSERVMNSKVKQAFLFIHGYNVTFEDAARRTAQISYDLGFDGAPVFYSWPSQGSVPAYTIDEQNIEWAQSNIRLFLDDFFTRSKAKQIYLIAHSMGNRGLTKALAEILREKPEHRAKLQEIILTAPDIDADVFKRDIAPALTSNGRPITLYASSKDNALKASKKVHGYSRAGDSGQNIVIIEGVETIDATNVSTSFLGHSYFAEDRSVLSDIYYLLSTRQRADRRFGLRRVDSSSGRYWKLEQ